VNSQELKNDETQDDTSIINTGALWVLAGFCVVIFLIVWLAFVGEQFEIL